MGVKQTTFETLFEQDYSFVDFIHYVDKHEDVYVLADGSLGQIWQIEPVCCEGKTEVFLQSLSQQIEQLMTRLPEGQIACQMIVLSSQNTHYQENKYRNYKEAKDSQSPFCESKLNHLKPLSRQITVYMTLRIFSKWPISSWSNRSILLEDLLNQHTQNFKKIMQQIEAIFGSAQIRFNTLDVKELIALVYQLLNPRRSQMILDLKYDQEKSIRDQVLFNEPKADGCGFMFEDYAMRVISVKELPGQTLPGMFSRELYEGLRFCVLDMATQFMMVFNFTVPPASESLNRLNWHKSFAFMHQDNWLGDKSIEALSKKKELDETITRLYRDGEKIVHARVHVILQSTDQNQLNSSADRLVGALSRLQCEAIVETMIGASLFLTCLPLGFDPYYERFIKRVKRLSSPNASDMLPLYGSFKGTKTPASLYLNRRGEMVWLDFFDSNINPHAVVIGASGAGKSFFMNDFILQHHRLGAHFFVLDKGDSYNKINRILGGQYIRFDLNNPITINPFSYPPTPENISFLQALLSQMASGVDVRDRLTREEEGLLQKAINAVYQNIRDEITLSDLVNVLNDGQFNDTYGVNSLMGPTLALRLTPFTKKGPYGGFFDGKNTFSIKGQFTVFELANLSSYSDLQTVILLNLMFYMTNFVSDPHMRPLRKYLLIDEAWSLLKVKNTADFITNAYKTFRKYRCCVTAVTQELADLTREESGLAIIANAANKVFLKQEVALIEILKEKLSFEDPLLEVLKSLETIKGKYAEAFVISEDIKGVVRLYADPLLYWSANSESKNNEYLSLKVNEYQGDFQKALEFCAKEYPYGVS